MRPAPKMLTPLVLSRRPLRVMFSGCRTAVRRISLKVAAPLLLEVIAKARSWKAAWENIGVVSGRNTGGTLFKASLKAAM